MTTAAGSSWKQFTFFSSQAVHDRLEPGQSPQPFKSTPEVSTVTAGQGHVVVADIHGQVHICNPDLDITRSFYAHLDNGRVTHLKFAGAKGVLVTLGEEEASPHPILKVWNIRHDDKKTGQPRLLASGRVIHGTRSHPVSTFAMTATLSLVAIGMADGTVLLLRQLDQYIQSAASAAAPANLPKPKLIHTSPAHPITGLSFTQASPRSGTTNSITGQTAVQKDDRSNTANITLFIVTTHQILTYTTTPTGKALLGSSAHATVLDDTGAPLNCSTLLPGGELVIAKEEAIFLYTPEGRGQSFVYEGPKSAVTTYLNYLIITSPPFVPTASSQSATVRNFVRDQRTGTAASTGQPFDSSTDIAKVTIFEPENRFVAYSGAFTEGVREVFCEWGDVFILTNDSKVSRLVERSTQDKLNMLFIKSQYLLAIKLARQAGLDESEVADIYRRFGDFHYDKGLFDDAMSQYIRTIGSVQPSYIIRKFLDGQRINNLTSYLQELHSQGLANSDITTLLLNCYAKLKDTERLDAFITSASVSTTGELPFDLETAIRVCRQAGYYDHAVYLAKTYNQPEEYLRIQIEDREQYGDAIKFIRTLGQEVAEENLRKYGNNLLAHLPKETTSLLVDLCCGTLDRPEEEPETSAPDKEQEAATAKTSYLSYLALTKSVALAKPAPTPSITQTPPPALTAQAKTSSAVPSVTVTRDARAREPSWVEVERSASPVPLASEPLPDIRQFFAHYIDQPSYFIIFLESIAARRWPEQKSDSAEHRHPDEKEQRDQEAVWNTLIEVYLAEAAASTSSPDRKGNLEAKALRLLQQEDKEVPLDLMQALLVCTTTSFIPGILSIYEKLEMFQDIIHFWIDRSRSRPVSPEERTEAEKEVLLALEEHGSDNHNLYPLVLRYLTSSSALLSKYQPDLLKVLERIDADKIMPPIAVVQTLSKSDAAKVGMIKEYLRRQIASEREETAADRTLSQSYTADITRKEKEIQELSDPDVPRVFQVTRCSACGGTLELPAVHFMCKHSYHQRCLADNEGSCPMCAASHGVIQEIKASNEQLQGRHDLFTQEVEEADDRFESVVKAFSRGLIRNGEE